MRKPPWSVNKGTYVAIEATLGTIPLIGSVLQSVLKLIFQTHEEQHQENIPLSLKVTSSAPGTITATATVANKKVVTDAKAGQEFAITVGPENGRTREAPLGDPSYEIKYKQEDDQERQPQPPVININLSGSHQARVNIGSSDESMNVICSDLRTSGVELENIAVFGSDYLRTKWPLGSHYLRMSAH